MNETDKALSDAINQTMGSANQATEFFAEQAPLVADQVITWAIISNAAAFVPFFSLSLFFAFACYRFCISASESGDKDDESVGALITAIFSLLFFIPSCAFAWEFMKCLIVPKLYLLEYARALVS